MKNSIIAAFIMFIGTTGQINASPVNNDKTPQKTNDKSIVEKAGIIGLSVDIDFGRRKRNCQGFGICKISVSADVNPESPVGRWASSGNGTLTFSIPVSYIKSTQPNKLQNLVGQTQFVVEEDYILPADVSAKLGAEGTLTIKEGSYMMTLREGILTVVIGDTL